MKFDFENKIKIDTHHNVPYFIFDKPRIENSGTVYHIPGSYLPVPVDGHYAHLLTDFIGAYYQLLPMYPDLKLIFFKWDRVGGRGHIKPAYDFAGLFNTQVLDIERNSYQFDKLFMFNMDVPAIPRKVWDNFEHPFMTEDTPERKSFTLESIRIVREKFIKYAEDVPPVDKLYSSRAIDNREAKFGPEWVRTHRLHNEIFDDHLESLLAKKGYQIMNFNNHTLFSQIGVFAKANIIAGIGGTNIYNGMWARQDSTIYQILVNPLWEYYNFDIFKTVGVENVYDVDVRFMELEKAIEFIVDTL